VFSQYFSVLQITIGVICSFIVDAEVKIAEAKESTAAATSTRGLGSKAAAKEQVWSKESDYN
jgi:hypothetical protein